MGGPGDPFFSKEFTSLASDSDACSDTNCELAIITGNNVSSGFDSV